MAKQKKNKSNEITKSHSPHPALDAQVVGRGDLPADQVLGDGGEVLIGPGAVCFEGRLVPLRAELAAQGTTVVGVLAVQTETALGSRMPPPRMSPEEVVADTLDAVERGENDEIAAGAQTRAAYQAFTADPKAFQAKMSARLPQPV